MLEPAKAYDGYVSYSYLEPGTDYAAFELADEIGRVPAYQGLDLTTEQRARADALLTDNVVISLHDHPSVFPKHLERDLHGYIRGGRETTGFAGLARSGMTAVFDNVMDGTCCISSPGGWKWQDVLHDLGMRMSDLAHQDYLIKVERLADIQKAHEQGRMGLVFALEAATMIENEVDRLDILYGFGVRQIGIAYSEANGLGSGLKERHDGGLTYFGEKAVARMNKLGLAIDVSHSGDRTSMDVIKASTKPIFMTHCGSREVWNTNRMKPDALIKAMTERGGVIGLEAAPHTTLSKAHPKHSLESVMDHFTHLVDVVGLEHVAFGPDTLFGDHVGLHDAFSSNLSIGQAHGQVDYEKQEYVDGLENPAECFYNIVGWLVQHGYSDDEIRAVVSGNILRVLEEVWV
ncbi:dipeptidase [Ornithinimicrobium faecis]|uniref:dipeptidase n=1 Tax=Ornithinimicrobium faecis TaxID=2934158 RepID=UPI002119A3E5|nr:membrane dipeptidase [Ornithinimicrobium sp. HY1745]